MRKLVTALFLLSSLAAAQVLISFIPALSAPALPAGAVFEWQLTEGSGTTAGDNTGSGYDGTITSATWTTSGSETVLEFDGSNDKIDIPDLTSESLTASTVCAVIKLDAATPVSAPATGIWRVSSDTSSQRNHYPYIDGTIYMRAFNGSRQSFSPSGSVTRTDWHMICVRSGGGVWGFFQDLNEVHTTTLGFSGPLSTGMYFGTSDSGSYWLDGQAAYVAWFDSALSDGEIADLRSYVNALKPGLGL